MQSSAKMLEQLRLDGTSSSSTSDPLSPRPPSPLTINPKWDEKTRRRNNSIKLAEVLNKSPLNMEEAERCIHDGADPNTKDRYGRTLLHLAVNALDQSLIQKALHLKVDIDKTNHYGITAFGALLDVKPLKMNLIEIFVEAHVQIDTRNSQGDALIHLAIDSGNCTIIQKAMRWGSDIKARDSEGLTALERLKAQKPLNQRALLILETLSSDGKPAASRSLVGSAADPYFFRARTSSAPTIMTSKREPTLSAGSSSSGGF